MNGQVAATKWEADELRLAEQFARVYRAVPWDRPATTEAEAVNRTAVTQWLDRMADVHPHLRRVRAFLESGGRE